MKICRLGALLVLLALAGCGMSEEDELRQWMAEQRQQAKPRVTPITEPKPFKPEPYTREGLADPFSKDKLTQALRRDADRQEKNPMLARELKRRKEPLEAFPLDALSMVGSIMKSGQPVALVRADKLIYQVRVGDYLGQNYGRVVRITETELSLREVAQDAVGEWVERPATLLLQEKVK